jgi:hypothetical protein
MTSARWLQPSAPINYPQKKKKRKKKPLPYISLLQWINDKMAFLPSFTPLDYDKNFPSRFRDGILF